MGRILLVVVSVALSVLAGVRGADAAATRAEKCAVAELKVAGAKAAAKLRCPEKALTQGRALTSACLARADASFTAACANVEAKGCATRATWRQSRTGWMASWLDRDETGRPRLNPSPRSS